MRCPARYFLLSALALAMPACNHAPGTKPVADASILEATTPKPKDSRDKATTGSANPEESAGTARPKRGGPLTGLFKKSPADGPKPTADAPAATPKQEQAKAEAKGESQPGEVLAPAKAEKKGLFAGLFKRDPSAVAEADDKPVGKKPGFRWPWSKPAPIDEDVTPVAAQQIRPKSEAIPYGLPTTPLVEIKPREPETSLAPAAAPPPAGKKANPIDDIGLYPEQ